MAKYPIAEMEIGDSFEVPCEPAKRAAICATVFNLARRRGVRLTSHRTERGIRLWRTEDDAIGGWAQAQTVRDPARAELIARRHLEGGETFQAIADDLGITRERVRQIARKVGVTQADSLLARGRNRVTYQCPHCQEKEELPAKKAATRESCTRCSRKISGMKRRYWTREKVIHTVQELAAEVGHTPTAVELMRCRGLCVTSIYREFGRLRDLMIAAGLEPRAVGHKTRDTSK